MITKQTAAPELLAKMQVVQALKGSLPHLGSTQARSEATLALLATETLAEFRAGDRIPANVNITDGDIATLFGGFNNYMCNLLIPERREHGIPDDSFLQLAPQAYKLYLGAFMRGLADSAPKTGDAIELRALEPEFLRKLQLAASKEVLSEDIPILVDSSEPGIFRRLHQSERICIQVRFDKFSEDIDISGRPGRALESTAHWQFYARALRDGTLGMIEVERAIAFAYLAGKIGYRQTDSDRTTRKNEVSMESALERVEKELNDAIMLAGRVMKDRHEKNPHKALLEEFFSRLDKEGLKDIQKFFAATLAFFKNDWAEGQLNYNVMDEARYYLNSIRQNKKWLIEQLVNSPLV